MLNNYIYHRNLLNFWDRLWVPYQNTLVLAKPIFWEIHVNLINQALLERITLLQSDRVVANWKFMFSLLYVFSGLPFYDERNSVFQIILLNFMNTHCSNLSEWRTREFSELILKIIHSRTWNKIVLIGRSRLKVRILGFWIVQNS